MVATRRVDLHVTVLGGFTGDKRDGAGHRLISEELFDPFGS